MLQLVPPPAAAPVDHVAWLSMVWTAANTIITVLSSIIALKSARIAERALAEQRDTRKEAARMRHAERMSEYYRRTLADPVLDMVPPFRREALMVVAEATAQLCALGPESRKADANACAQSLITRFNSNLEPLMDQILVRARSWGDQTLLAELTAELTTLQDNITAMTTHAMAEPEPARGKMEQEIDDRCTAIIGCVVKWDLDQFQRVAVGDSKLLKGERSSTENRDQYVLGLKSRDDTRA